MNKTLSKLLTGSLLVLALSPSGASAQMPASVQSAVDSMNQQTMNNAISAMNQGVIDAAYAEQQKVEQEAAARKARWRKLHPPSQAVLRRERQATADAAYIERKRVREEEVRYAKEVAESDRINAANDEAQRKWSEDFAKEQRETDMVAAIAFGIMLSVLAGFAVWIFDDIEKMNRRYSR